MFDLTSFLIGLLAGVFALFTVIRWLIVTSAVTWLNGAPPDDLKEGQWYWSKTPEGNYLIRKERGT